MTLLYKLFKKIFFRRLVEDIERAGGVRLPDYVEIGWYDHTEFESYSWGTFIDKLK